MGFWSGCTSGTPAGGTCTCARSSTRTTTRPRAMCSPDGKSGTLPYPGGKMWWAEHTEWPEGLDDLVNYAWPVAPGVIQLKDGALLAAWTVHGPDLDLSTAEELEQLSDRGNEALSIFGSGWMLHMDEINREAPGYMEPGAFPDAISRRIDEERRATYLREGTHYQRVHTLALTWLPNPIEEEVERLITTGEN